MRELRKSWRTAPTVASWGRVFGSTYMTSATRGRSWSSRAAARGSRLISEWSTSCSVAESATFPKRASAPTAWTSSALVSSQPVRSASVQSKNGT